MNDKEQSSIQLTKGQRFPLTIKRLGINGEGVGYFKKKVVFVKGALPGEEVVVEVTKASQRFTEAKIRKLRKTSQERQAPPCPIYNECGGCQLQHMDYAATLRGKKDIVAQAFYRYTKLSEEKLPLNDTIGMDNPWFYRNKSQLQTRKTNGTVAAGLYKEGTHELIDLSECLVQHKELNAVTQVVKTILQDLSIPIYDEKKHNGQVRTIVTRVGFESGQVQLVLVTRTKEFAKKELLIEKVRKKLPQVTSFMQNINHERTSLIFGENTHHLDGEETINERLGEFAFDLSARAFFQLNPAQTVKLYNEAKKAAKLTGKENVIDAYCGVGTIGQWVGKNAKEVRGMDTTKEAIADARKNAKQHGIRASYEVGTAEKWMPVWLKEGFKPDVVIVDPPRSGCDGKLLQSIVKAKPKRVVYVSCNPSTLAKDIEQLMKKGYKIKNIQPVDMFPWTAQVESVTELTL
ncbi:23S rRNA (uracil(1939)-C(5))-methyltransferase RlmD [Shouchella hunanensis]|uniref:23S rRNA (Uracil(1939)-C(5))-methyltransferase RlmD n=1 Tax=Shouchella hunanensis TaxID=766894 RepID=A0ABY7W175_9BACI|nr:23S rRNA (uracil(1939)-C(5))-methyltransferase RlmD [Shouchella hunanensis]WDF02705.1 23S rRNA (uracil(1939)-C(5))-methyltransferase RlmD [Shouchella hunanensis]